MPRYQFTAVAKDGSPRRGAIEADTIGAAEQQLTGESLTAIEVMPVARSSIRRRRKLSKEAADLLTRTLVGASESGIPLSDLLSAQADDLADTRLADAARQLAKEISRGVPLEDAISAISERLPKSMRGVMEAGIQSGRLADVMEGYSRQQVVRKNITQTLWSTLAYPLLVAVCFIPILLIIAFWIVPLFKEMFLGFGITLPRLTESVIELFEQIPLMLAVLLGLPLCLAIGIKVFHLRRLDHRLRAAMPVAGRMWTWAGQYELASMLATFLENHLTLPDALEYTAATVHDCNVARACRWASGQVGSGRSLGATFSDSMHIDPMLTQQVHWGESVGALPDTLRLAADLFHTRVTHRAAFLTRVLPVIGLFVVGGFMIGTVVVAMLLPLVNLMSWL